MDKSNETERLEEDTSCREDVERPLNDEESLQETLARIYRIAAPDMNWKLPPGLSSLLLQASELNRDYLKVVRPFQETADSINSYLVEHIDFGFSHPIMEFAPHFAALQSAWLERILPSLKTLKVSYYPENLQPIEDLRACLRWRV